MALNSQWNCDFLFFSVDSVISVDFGDFGFGSVNPRTAGKSLIN